MTDYSQTILEVCNHLIQKHPTLAAPIERLARTAQGKRSEFDDNIARWFAAQGDSTLRLDYPLDANSTVLDLGGYQGDFAADIFQRYGCTVYVFEPVKEFYTLCAKRFAGNPKIHCFNYGASDRDEFLNISNDANASSITRNNTAENCETIEVRELSKIVSALDINRIDLLKINVEGAEFPILKNILGNDLAKTIRNFQVQFHEFYPDSWRLRDNLRLQLLQTHDEMWNYPFVWESWKIR